MVKKEDKLEVSIARQHNEFIMAPHSLNNNTFKVFIFLLSKIKTTDTSVPEIKFSLEDVRSVLKMNKNSLRYDAVIEILDELHSKDKVRFKIGTKIAQYHFIDYFHADSKTKQFNVKFKAELKPYILELKHYTKSNVELICSFRSFYSSRVYQILKMYFGKFNELDYSEVDIDVLRLREVLKIPDGTYPDYSQLKREIIERAKKEINSNNLSDIKFSYSEIKGIGSKKVIGIKFQIHKNKEIEVVNKDDLKLTDKINIIETKINNLKEQYQNEITNYFGNILKQPNECDYKEFIDFMFSIKLEKLMDNYDYKNKNLEFYANNIATDGFYLQFLLNCKLPADKQYLRTFEDWKEYKNYGHPDK